MQTEQIVALLVAERDRLNRAIEALNGSSKPAKATAAPAPVKTKASAAAPSATSKKTRKPLTAAQRKAHSERMREFWAARRKQKPAK
jgi:hypothetical protein